MTACAPERTGDNILPICNSYHRLQCLLSTVQHVLFMHSMAVRNCGCYVHKLTHMPAAISARLHMYERQQSTYTANTRFHTYSFDDLPSASSSCLALRGISALFTSGEQDAVASCWLQLAGSCYEPNTTSDSLCVQGLTSMGTGASCTGRNLVHWRICDHWPEADVALQHVTGYCSRNTPFPQCWTAQSSAEEQKHPCPSMSTNFPIVVR